MLEDSMSVLFWEKEKKKSVDTPGNSRSNGPAQHSRIGYKMIVENGVRDRDLRMSKSHAGGDTSMSPETQPSVFVQHWYG